MPGPLRRLAALGLCGALVSPRGVERPSDEAGPTPAAAPAWRLDVAVDGTPEALAYRHGDDLWGLAHGAVEGRGIDACAGVEASNRQTCAAALVVELLAAAFDHGPAAVGCPAGVPLGAAVGLFVAVPSARRNRARRDAIRRTWCQSAAAAADRHGRTAAAAVKFFVGAAGDASEDSAVGSEKDFYGDIVEIEGLVDAATNVTGKLLASLAYFSALPARFTHFARVEDDVYLFSDRLLFELRRLCASADADRRVLGAFYDEGWLRYPRGFAVVLPRRVASALSRTQADVGYGVRSRQDGALRPEGAVGCWVRGKWWHDDAFLGLLLYPLDVALDHEPRLHDLPGRGPHARSLSHASLAVNGMQTDAEFDTLHAGGSIHAGVARAWRRDAGGIIVDAAFDGAGVEFQMSNENCAGDANANANRLCDALPRRTASRPCLRDERSTRERCMTDACRRSLPAHECVRRAAAGPLHPSRRRRESRILPRVLFLSCGP
ncbi:hypothetical protein M885DRAFT_191827 [Pelagophyceae sp. CCMP2097]|nr:hypothetical protein M885DRAFT_191827 [Pelagophyceae sp. CCMP2097]